MPRKELNEEELKLEKMRVVIREKEQAIEIKKGLLVRPTMFSAIIDQVFIDLNLAISQPKKELLLAICAIFEGTHTTLEMRMSQVKTILTEYYRARLTEAGERITAEKIEDVVTNALAKENKYARRRPMA